MDDVYYSTEQAARELGVTQARVRALCGSEAIEATCTADGQFRIRRDEVERRKHEGLPPIPRPLPEPDRARPPSVVRHNRGEVALLAEPSEAAIDSAEEVVRLENEVRSIGLRREKEEGLDWFRERESREAQRQAELAEADRVRRAGIEADRLRQRWEAKWTQFALRSVPNEAPPVMSG